MNNDIIVCTWGIGPSYRKRVIDHINKAINSGYDKIFPYLILTDKPDDFCKIQEETGLIKKIVNIHTEREKHSKWSKEHEFIPVSLTEEGYGLEFRNKNLNERKVFSYGVHRFYYPAVSELGYSKFLHCDSDFNIRYDKITKGECSEEEFMLQFNTPVNTMKGCNLETFLINKDRCDIWNNSNIILACFLRYFLKNEFNKSNFKYLTSTYTQTEGPFRYYNFSSSKDILEYFKIVDKGLEIALKDRIFESQLLPNGYCYIDNVVTSIANEMMGIEPIEFSTDWYTPNVYYEDRYFFPVGHQSNVDGQDLSLRFTSNISEFMKENSTLLKFLKPNIYG